MKKLVLVLFLFLIIVSFKKKEITWVAISDSITYLNDHQNETANRITEEYLTMVTEKLQMKMELAIKRSSLNLISAVISVTLMPIIKPFTER